VKAPGCNYQLLLRGKGKTDTGDGEEDDFLIGPVFGGVKVYGSSADLDVVARVWDIAKVLVLTPLTVEEG